jgi:signal transduction histidine kinase
LDVPDFRLRIRAKLLLGTLLVLLPFLVQNLWWFGDATELRERSVLMSLRQSAELAGVVVDRAFDGVLALAATLASDSDLPLADPSSLRRRVTRLERSRRDVASVGLWSANGDPLVEAAEPRHNTPRISDQPSFGQALRTGQATLSDVLPASGGDPLVVASAPLESGEGVASAALRLDAISEHLSAVKLRPGQDLFLVDPQGRLAFHTASRKLAATASLNVADHPLVREALTAGSATVAAAPSLVGNIVRAFALVKTPVHGWIAGIAWDQHEAFGGLRREREQLLAMFAVIAALSFVGAWSLATYLTARLRKLAAMMGELTRGEFARRAAPGRSFGRDEVDDLTTAFEVMARALAEERRKRETFVSGVAHEMRNMLAPLFLSARMLGQERDPARSRLYERLLVLIGRVNRLVMDLVDAGRIQTGKFAVSLEPMDLMQVIHQAVEDVRLLAVEHRVVVDGPESLMVVADADRVAQVVANLLGNAVKYAREAPEILLTVRTVGSVAEVCVQDQGPGISAEEAQGLFEPYARLESRRDQPGVGLGLFISRAIVEAHRGALRVASGGPGTGTAFCFTLPLSRAASPS